MGNTGNGPLASLWQIQLIALDYGLGAVDEAGRVGHGRLRCHEFYSLNDFRAWRCGQINTNA